MQILLIEDDPTIARELALRWRDSGWSLTNCGTLAAASQALPGADLVVLDLQLPDGDGLEWLKRLRASDRNLPVLVLTARDTVSDRVAGLRCGADDYLVKPFSVEELDARVEVLQRRACMQHGLQAQFGPLVWLQDEGTAVLHGQLLSLQPREFEVLGLLVRRAPRVVAKRLLIDALAERNLEVGDSAAEVYVSRLRRKLTGSALAIQTVRGFGYRLIESVATAQDCDGQDA